jgi:hypothetical protein
MSKVSNFVSSAVEKLIFHPVTITHTGLLADAFGQGPMSASA